MFAAAGTGRALGAAQLLAAPGIWRSTWAVFGWFNVAVDAWVYWLYSGLAALGCAGWLIVVLNRRFRLESGLRWTAAGLLAGWSLVVALALLRWAQINYPQGRLLFPAIAAAMALLAVGLLAWVASRVAAGCYCGNRYKHGRAGGCRSLCVDCPAMFRRTTGRRNQTRQSRARRGWRTCSVGRLLVRRRAGCSRRTVRHNVVLARRRPRRVITVFSSTW